MTKPIALALGLLLCLTALTAAGNGEDPLISLSYLTGDFSATLDAAISAKLDASDEAIRAGWSQTPPSDGSAEAPGISGLVERTLKEGDVLSGSTGLSLTPLGGDVRLDAAGAVVDVTEGAEVSSGQLLRQNHRYIVAEDAAVSFVVASPAAVVSYEGGGTLALSLAPDYYAMSCALRERNLFQGSGSGIGEGFDLYKAPSRGEGLVMFLRILGEEEQALASGGGHPFTDVPGWLDPYVSWAYQRGYANGIAAGKFGCTQPISAIEYEEFLLRALGYSTVGVDDYSTSLERALACGALTAGEYEVLRSGGFLRAHVAYISYYALDMPVNGSENTLAQRLTAAEVMTEEQLVQARSQVNSSRIS